MAYNKANFQLLEEFPIESTVKIFLYLSTDSVATMTAAGYVSDAGTKRVQVGDLVHVVNQTAPGYTLLQVGSVSGTSYAQTATLELTSTDQSESSSMPRNLIDGGDFTTNPWQRGTTPSAVTGTTVTYVADRFFAAGATTCSITVTDPVITGVPGYNNALQFARTSANASTTTLFLGQVLEAADVYRTRGQFLTLSFWALAGANYSPTTAATAKVTSGTTANEGAAVSIGAGYAGAVTGFAGLATLINATFVPTTTWQQFTFTSSAVVGATVAELALQFSMTPVGTAGTNDNIQFAGIQLEIGSQPTPFEHLDAAMVIERCQRYCFVLNEPATTTVLAAVGQCYSVTTARIVIPLPVPMYKAPTLTFSAGSFSVTATTGTAVTITSGGGGTAQTVNAIGLIATVASGLLSGYATVLGGTGGGGSIVASADL